MPTEDAADLLAPLGAGGALAGVVEGLLARLLVPVRSDGEDAGSAVDTVDLAGKVWTAESEGLFSGEPGGDAALAAVAEVRRVASVEEAASSGLMALGAAGLAELAAACHRLVAWASWGEALAAACLTGCGELSTHPDQWGPDGAVSPVVGFEERRFNTTCLLSARLGLSRTQAGQIVDHGSALMDVGFGPTEAMERCGVLDAAKASLVTRRLGDVPAPVALAVQERVLPQAPRRSVSQVGRDIERALMEVDPAGHAERVRVNVSRRCVSRPRPVGEGVSQIRLVLPTMDALLLDATLDAIAASARACGEQRTPAQLRADALGAMALSTLRTSQQAAYHRPTQAPDDGTSGGIGGSDGLGSAGGFGGGLDGLSELGPVPTSLAPPRRSTSLGRLLPDGVPLEGLLSSLSSLVGTASPWWTPSGTGHLALPAGIHVDVQVTVPLTSLAGLAPPEDPTGRGDPRGSECSEAPRHPKSGRASPDQNPTVTTDPLNGAAPRDSRRSLPTTSSRRSLPTTGGRTLPGSSRKSLPTPDPATPASQPAASFTAAPVPQATASLSAAGGVAQVRIGARSVAVPAMTAWALAAGGAWRRLVTDPASGVVIDVGRTRYRPPAGLADLVRARDRACVFPTCQTPAERCDIDHLTAWSQGGTTSLDNLTTLCQAHHRLKHTPGWSLSRADDGSLVWRTPSGARYRREADGTILRLPRRVGPRHLIEPGGPVPDHLAAAVTGAVLDRLERGLADAAPAALTTRGPRPGQQPGAFETRPYPRALHALGLAALLDEVPAF